MTKRYTHRTSMHLECTKEYEELDVPRAAKISMRPTFSAEGFCEQVDYPIIVQAWEWKRYGRGRRRWLSTFTEAERDKIGKWQARFSRWYLVEGTPRRVALSFESLSLLKKAVEFFATIREREVTNGQA